MSILNWITALLVAGVCAYCSRYYLHMMQLESYQTDGYERWLKKNSDKILGWTLNLGVICAVGQVVLYLILNMLLGSTAADVTSKLLTLTGFTLFALRLNAERYGAGGGEKKPFAMTKRMQRLYLCLFLLSCAGTLLLQSLSIPSYLFFIALPYLSLVAARIMEPIEKKVNASFLNDAKKRLNARPELIKIGITGSYGKTSTKFILAAILGEKYKLLATPASFNTPMGLTRVIREKLLPEHQLFLAEMGARHVGDIKELTELVRPRYGVLTSVGPQHLETFGTIENVARTKNELIMSLPADGAAFFAADGGFCDKLYAACPVEKYRAGLSGGYLDMYAEEIVTGPFGSRFTLCDAEGGRAACETKLLGAHNIANIVLGAMVGKRLGLSLAEIASGIKKIQPVEHRLQLIPGANGITVIDDAFNANPVGAKAALEVLGAFPGRHVIVTPGMVEQGEREEELNYAFGAQLSAVCDEAILVGRKHTRPIVKGALDAGFDKNRLHLTGSLEEATAVIARIGKSGDAVLFENDLPDNYSES